MAQRVYARVFIMPCSGRRKKTHPEITWDKAGGGGAEVWRKKRLLLFICICVA